MSTLIARNDAAIVRQVTTLTPTVTNLAVYDVLINTKLSGSYTADASATAQEIVEGLKALLAAHLEPEYVEATWTENDTTIIGTGPTTGHPFTVTDGAGSGTWASITTGTVAKSPNHWIAENFTGGALPVSTDTVILSQLTEAQSFYWGLDQNAVALAVLDIRADSEAQIGLPERNSGGYYEYRDTHLKIDAAILKIGDGSGNGSRRIKLNLTGSAAAAITVYKTAANSADPDEACVHLVGSHATNTLLLMSGSVDIAMLPNTTAQYSSITATGGRLRCGAGVTLATLEAAGNGSVETRGAVTTIRTRDNGSVQHLAGAITTADVEGGPLTIKAKVALTITTCNLYSGSVLDLSDSEGLITLTNCNVYSTPSSPARIIDPNNRIVMSNPAAAQNGFQSLVIESGPGKTIRLV